METNSPESQATYLSYGFLPSLLPVSGRDPSSCTMAVTAYGLLRLLLRLSAVFSLCFFLFVSLHTLSLGLLCWLPRVSEEIASAPGADFT